MSDLDILRGLASEKYPDPFELRIGEKRFLCVTNGAYAVGKESTEEYKGIREDHSDYLENIFSKISGPEIPIDMDRFKKWVGEKPYCEKCSNTYTVRCLFCAGDFDIERNCEHCDEVHDCFCNYCYRGRQNCDCIKQEEVEAGRIEAVVVNRVFIRKILPSLGDRKLFVILPKSLWDPILFKAEGWFMLLMGLTDQPNAPRFELAEGCG